MTTTHTRRPLAVGIVLGGITALACACSNSSDPAPSASVSSQPSTVPGSSSLTGPAAAALAAYQEMWHDVAEASNTADYQASYLTDHLAGSALLTITANMAVEHKQGIVAHGVPALHPVVASAAATSATISDCLGDQSWIEVYASTGKPINDIPGGFRSVSATVTESGGAWKVTQLVTGAEGTCTLSQ